MPWVLQARAARRLSRAALRAAAGGPLPVGRDDPRLHPPDVSAVPAEPRGLRLRARVDVERGPAVGPDPHGVGGLEARHPALLQRAAGEGGRRLQRHRRAVLGRAAGRGHRARARALPARSRLRALRRQHQAAQEPRAADRGVRRAAQGGLRRAEAAHHRRRDLEAAGAAPRRPQPQAAQARALPRLPARRDAGHPLPPGRGVRLPVALRRLRPAAARGDGERHAGGHLERLVAARGHRRRGRAGRSLRRRRRSSTASAAC